MFHKPPKTQIPNAALELNQCLAKTYGEKQAGRSIVNHCRIVGEVALELLQRMPENLRTELFPEGSALIAACHDLGKVSPTFQEKIYRGTEGYLKNSRPGLENINPDIETGWGGHAGLSQATAQCLTFGKFIPEILGQHHGYSPNVNHCATDEVFGGAVWQQRREELLAELKTALHTEFPEVKSPLQARVLAGFTTVADWIGSGSLFDKPEEDWQALIQQALDNAGFVPPRIKPSLSFDAVFNFQPHDTQQRFIAQVTGPGVYVLEAPMGLGKTEAALYAAYKMLASNQATGIYFALPTQLTSDKIHERVADFLQKILAEDSAHQQPLLLHANAWLKTELGKEGNPGGSWFQQGKRGILAPFAVGTIDQALMAVMNVKHGFVRTFGLIGKVVILDEVHSYDGYTGVIVQELVQALRQLQCTVIILSATLTRLRRDALLDTCTTKTDYPLIAALPKTGVLTEQTVQPLTPVQVIIQQGSDDSAACEEALLRAEQGQQVLWIENTVAEAQAVYRKLAAVECNPKIECGLLHSRFVKCDRERNEQHWTHLYGKDADGLRQQCGRILVGTQVLEQSLDIDADFLISRIAPTDMLLQRIGRLWRHSTTLRPEQARREAWLLSPELASAIADPEQAFQKTAKVYSPYVLCRSLEVWRNLKQIELPLQIRDLIEATYSAREESGALLKYFNVLEKKREDLKRMALLGLSQGGTTLPEEKAATRYSEQDSVEVLLLKSYRLDKQKGGAELVFPDESRVWLPEKGKGLLPLQRRELAAQLLHHTVRVADYLAPKATAISNLNWLQGYVYLGKAGLGESLLRVAKVKDSGGVVSLNDDVATDKITIQYDSCLGYQAD